MKHTATITKPDSTERILKGEFTYENGKLSFVCHTQNVEFAEVREAITAMRDECQRQITNQKQCPFHIDAEQPVDIDREPSIPDHKGERVITWDKLDRMSNPTTHLKFTWTCPYCGNHKNELCTSIPKGLAEVICNDSECEAFMYLEKLKEQ